MIASSSFTCLSLSVSSLVPNSVEGVVVRRGDVFCCDNKLIDCACRVDVCVRMLCGMCICMGVCMYVWI